MLEEGECITLYDLKTLFHICSSGPCHLHYQTKVTTGLTSTQQDLHVHKPHQDIARILCKTVMGFPISFPIVADLFIEEFDPQHCPHPPRLWLRYEDDTFAIQKAEHSQQFLHHINSIDLHIQFTVGVPKNNGPIPFLDTLVTPGPNSRLLTSVYRKPTHQDQYFHWESHHNLSDKYSVFNTLAHRATTFCTNT